MKITSSIILLVIIISINLHAGEKSTQQKEPQKSEESPKVIIFDSCGKKTPDSCGKKTNTPNTDYSKYLK